DKAGVKAGSATASINGQQIRAGGDVITAIDGKPVTGMNDVISAVNAKQPRDQVQLTLQHGSQRRTVTVTLANRPANVGGERPQPPGDRPRPPARLARARTASRSREGPAEDGWVGE